MNSACCNKSMSKRSKASDESKASVIVPLLSQQDAWLEHCLLSVLNQTVTTTVLVVTSADTPTSNLQILQNLADSNSKLQWFQRQPDHVFAGAINEGLQQARTERVGLLLSDDWLSAHAIERCLIEDADIISTGHIGYKANGQDILWRRQLRYEDFEALTTLEARASYLTHFFLFRRATVLAVGGVDTQIGHVGPDDYDLPWTLLEQGASVALVDEPMYHYRDHYHTRLTLRPQEEQIRDLRRLLAKHGVKGKQQDRLVEQKARWYGVPCHVARENPDWYRFQKDEIDLGHDLYSLVEDVGIPLVGTTQISKDEVGGTGRSCFRLVFADGSVIKGRTVASNETAHMLFELAPIVADLPLAPVLARQGNALLEQWIDGVVLEPGELGAEEAEVAEKSGGIMGRLAVLSESNSSIDSQPRESTSKLDKLDHSLDVVKQAHLLNEADVKQLAQLARGNAPELLATGLVHLDICPANLVTTGDGLCLIDNESLAQGALAQDLARTWYLWPMNRRCQRAFLRGYSRFRSPMDFIRHEVFWSIVTLASAVEFRLSMNWETTQLIEALKCIANGELPGTWLSPASESLETNRPIHVGFICDYLAVGGQERALLNLLAGFDTNRFCLHVYAFRGGEMAERIKAMGISLLIGSPKPPLNWKQSWTTKDVEEKLAYRRQLTEALRHDNIDAVVNFAWPDGVGAACEANVRVMIERLDGPGLLDKINDKSSFDSVVCQSATIHDQLFSQSGSLGLDRDRIELIYSGIDLERFDSGRFCRNAERQRLGLSANELVIGYIGRLAAGKNIKVLIKAFARIDEKVEGLSVKLIIMGPDAGDLHQLKIVCERLGLNERVLFVEPVEDVAPTLVALDIFAIPTLGEGIPNAILEAMAMGLPIVAADVGSIHEVIDGNGFLVPQPDPVTFARPLKRLIRSVKLRERCGTNSQRIAQRFNLKYAVKEYELLIIRHLARKQTARI